MAQGPCRNPSCHSHGISHPNCRCYGGYAEGGTILTRCDMGAPHDKGCEYYAEGGEPSPRPNDAPPADDGHYAATKQWADSLVGDAPAQGDEVRPEGSPIDLVAGAAGSALAGPALDALGSSAVRSLASDEAGVLRLSGPRPAPVYSVMEAGEAPAAPGAIQRAQSALNVQTPEAVMNTEGATLRQVAPAQGAAGRPMPSATPKGSFRPKRMADGGGVAAEPLPAAQGTLPTGDASAPDAASPAPQTVAAPTAGVQEDSSGVPIYDISGEKPIFGHMHPDDVHDAVASGAYSLPKGSSVPVFSPDGQLGDISADEAPDAFKNGYKYATPNDIEQHTYGTGGQQVLAGLEGAAKGVLGPIAPAVEEATGLTTGKDILAREHANPWTHGVSEAATLVGGALTGVGEGALLSHAGELAAKVLGPKSATTLAKIGARSIADATQMVIYQGGNEVSKLIENDPNQSVGSAATDIGLSGLLGAGIGGAFGSVSPLWKATVGNKVGTLVEDFKGRLNFLRQNPDLNEGLTKELSDHYDNVRSAADEVYGPQGIKAKSIASALPQEMHEGIQTQSQGFADQMGEKIQAMKADPQSYPPRLTTKLEEEYNNYLGKVTQPGAKPSDVFNAGQDLKQQLQGYAKFEKRMSAIDEGYDFVKTAKDLAHSLRTNLEDTDVWGKAGSVQQKINSAFSDYLPTLKDFESKFTTKVEGEPRIDPAKVSTYLNQLGKPTSDIKKEMLSNFLAASEKYQQVIHDAHLALGSESPIKPSSLAIAQNTLSKLPQGAKMADFFVKRGAAYLAGEGIGTAVGGALGHLVGAPGFGAQIGERALGPFFTSVLPGIVKPLLEKTTDSAAFKAATDFGLSVAKGEAKMTNTIKSIFKSTGEVATESNLKSLESSRAKLDAQLQKLQKDPTPMVNMAQGLGHYMPGHAAAAAATAATAVNYLNNLRPNTAPKRPLDSKIPPDPVAKAKYNRALDIANQPLIVMNAIKTGRLTQHDVITLHTVNPGAYERMSQKLMAEMTNRVSKGDNIPYRTRQSMSLFLGQALDSSMTPSSILAAQPKPEQSQPPTPTTGGQRPKTSTSSLGKMAKGARTSGQAREARGIARND